MTENRCADFESQKATNAWLTEFPPYKAAINMRIKTQSFSEHNAYIQITAEPPIMLRIPPNQRP